MKRPGSNQGPQVYLKRRNIGISRSGTPLRDPGIAGIALVSVPCKEKEVVIRFSQQENRISLFLPHQLDEKPPCLPVASAAPRVSCKPIADNSLGRNWTGIQLFFFLASD